MKTEGKQIGLVELQEQIKDSVEGVYKEHIWVCAEISEIKNHPSGHCYLTLIEKDKDGDGVSAKAAAIIWSSSYRVVRPYFETTTGEPLSVGMHILVTVQVQYSILYGVSLIVYDIDPSFTVGEIELERQRTIKRLQEEGMFEMNTTLVLPLLPRRFAVISSDTAAGYRDFMNHLHNNEYDYKFYTKLFSAPMQGKDAPNGIISALEEIADQIDSFDAVLVLRGGGSSHDLACFDDYNLAVNIAQFPIPVLTGIGHDQDYHIVDMVAYANVKTPTALADYIIDFFVQEEYQISSLASRLQLALSGKWQQELSRIEKYKLQINNSFLRKIVQEKNKIELYEYKIASLNPVTILEKGFVVALKEGERLDSIEKIVEGDNLTLMFKDGIVECVVKSKTKNQKK